MRLLVCDGDASVLETIKSVLDDSDLGLREILGVNNGKDAIAALSDNPPELMLCGMMMPDCSGIDVLKHIHDNKVETRFCFLAGNSDFEYAHAALRYGARHYVSKPVEREELIASVRHMVSEVRDKKSALHSGWQAQYESILNSVLRQISDGIYGANQNTINSLLARNSLRFKAEDTWRIVQSCADMTPALRSSWSQERIIYTVGRFHDESLVGNIGCAYTLVSTDGKYVMCSCFVPDDVCGEVELRARCRLLREICNDHMLMKPTILVSEPFPLREAAFAKGEMIVRIRNAVKDEK